MAIPDQKAILLERSYNVLKSSYFKLQDESGDTELEVKTLPRELARI